MSEHVKVLDVYLDTDVKSQTACMHVRRIKRVEEDLLPN